MHLLKIPIVLLFGISLGCSGGRPLPTDPSLLKTNTHQKLSKSISPKLIQSLQKSDIILIGETHDHPQHHSLQSEIIRLSKVQSVAFEMLNQGQEEAIAKLSQTPSENWDQLLAWSHRGWPKFDLYRQVFESSLKHAQYIIPAHPSSQTLHPLKLGLELDQKLKSELKLDQSLPKKQEEILRQEIIQAHCGHASERIVQAMMSAQRLKDAWMARALIKAAKPVILIVGRGHIQAQRGIPWAINLLAPDNSFKVMTIALSPENLSHSLTNKNEPETNIQQFKLQIKAHRNDDPCERFKEQLKRLKKHSFKGHDQVKTQAETKSQTEIKSQSSP